MNKENIRIFIKNCKRQITEEQLRKQSFAQIRQLIGCAQMKAAHSLLLYYSLPDEVDTHTLIDWLVILGKKVYLPKVIDGERMEIREYTGKDDLAEGAFHIMEPTGTVLPRERYGEIEMGVIPGVAFDKEGHRVGRGKGYYDRLLAELPHMYKVGLGFSFQKLESIQVEPTDITMDAIV